jgi:transcriptional regulator with XRE-family HTH domain
MPRLLGEKLHRLRRQNKMTQVELAQKLGLLSQSHIAKIEADDDTASLSLVIHVTRLLNISTDYLLRDDIPVESTARTILPVHLGESESTFGARLRSLRLQHHLTQRQLAQRLGLASRAYIGGLEASQGKLPSMDLIVRIADLFEVTTDALLLGPLPASTDSEPPPSER